MVEASAARFFSTARTGAIGFRYKFAGDVPPSRGLGSSVTIRAGIVAALNALSGVGLSSFQIASIVTDLEGHPDNATAGVLGGLCVGRSAPDDGRLLDVVRFEVPDSLAFVVASPELEVKTSDSRSVLPSRIPFGDAVRSVNGASFFVAAFASGDYAKLRHGFDDFLHEPHRLPNIPGAQDALGAGRAAGALGAWLSGSGSSVASANLLSNPLTAWLNRYVGQQLPELGGSDSHVPFTAGQAMTLFPGRSAADLRQAIEQGTVQAGGTVWKWSSLTRLVTVLAQRGLPRHTHARPTLPDAFLEI
jgi:homoserine kinase